jgi:uncharacterized cofD-like protein
VTGNFDLAIQECSRVLKIRGRVLPSTLESISLWAERMAGGPPVSGETAIGEGEGPCRRVWLEPEPQAHGPAVRATEEADLVLLGPGSLFTSVLPHLAVPEIAGAVAGERGRRAYICNVMTQPGETDGFDAAAHLERVLEAVPGGVDMILVHEGPLDPHWVGVYAAKGQRPVPADHRRLEAMGVRVVAADLADRGRLVRHSPEALAAALLEVVAESPVN